jgi:hypothetical protein
VQADYKRVYEVVICLSPAGRRVRDPGLYQQRVAPVTVDVGQQLPLLRVRIDVHTQIADGPTVAAADEGEQIEIVNGKAGG